MGFGFSKSKSESASAAIDQKVGDYRGRFDGRVTIGGSGQFANAKASGANMASSPLAGLPADWMIWARLGLFVGSVFYAVKAARAVK